MTRYLYCRACEVSFRWLLALLGVFAMACGQGQPTQVTLATMNLANGAGPKWSNAQVRKEQRDFFATFLHADVLAMQEVDLGAPRSQNANTALEVTGLVDTFVSFELALSGDVKIYHAPEGTLVFGKVLTIDASWNPKMNMGDYGLALYLDARFPVRKVELWDYKGETDEQRAALVVYSDRFTVINTHLSVYGADPKAYRANQLAQLKALVDSIPGEVVVMGDFNAQVQEVRSVLQPEPLKLVSGRVEQDRVRTLAHVSGLGIDQIWATQLGDWHYTYTQAPTDHGVMPSAQITF